MPRVLISRETHAEIAKHAIYPLNDDETIFLSDGVSILLSNDTLRRIRDHREYLDEPDEKIIRRLLGMKDS